MDNGFFCPESRCESRPPWIEAQTRVVSAPTASFRPKRREMAAPLEIGEHAEAGSGG
jgi:hypothetical protein